MCADAQSGHAWTAGGAGVGESRHPFSRSSACSVVSDSGDRTRRAIRSGGVSAWRGRAGGATITKIQHPAIAKRIRRDISMPPEFKELDALTIAAARAEI